MSTFSKIAILLGVVMIAFFSFIGLERIDAGHVGIKVNLIGTGKGVDNATEVTGWVFYNRFTTKIVEFPTFVQHKEYKKDGDTDESFIINSKDGSEFHVSPLLNYSVQRDKVPYIFTKYRVELDAIEAGFLKTAVYDAFRVVANSYTADELISNRELFEIKVRKNLENHLLPEGFILDGELYVHNSPEMTDKVSFETLGVLRKTKNLTKEDTLNLNKIQYHVYDMIDTKLRYNNRKTQLSNLLDNKNFKMIKNVLTIEVNSEEEIKDYHNQFVNTDGYEGTMIRSFTGMYKEKYRSFDLLKFKDFNDDEFEIVDYTFEKDTSGADKNLIVWVIKIKEDVICKVRPKGTKEQRQKLYEECGNNFSKFKGRKLWTKFFEYTSDGNLRFPTTKTNDVSSYIRDEII